MASLLRCVRFLPTPSSSPLRSSAQVRTYCCQALSPTRKRERRRSLNRLLSSLSSFEPLAKHRNPNADGTTADLWLYNTMSRKKEVFIPKVEGKVGIYVCGITAYDLSHIGHARVYVTFDVLYRQIS
uniref:Uncharacterized protein MANES_03G012700 n=1 Tax=Rhizophora mucronata TaxID=61149 RepID=A0A2P2LL36_RHIMU